MKLEGKIINFLGDSITEGAGVFDIENCRYDRRILHEKGLAKANNYGIGGTRLAYQVYPSEDPKYDYCFCDRARCMDKNADVIVVYGGVNDFMHGDAPIGTDADETPETFIGAVKYLIKFLKRSYPRAKLVFMTPAHCVIGGVDDDYVSPYPNKQSDAMPLRGYVDIIKKWCSEYDVKVADLYNELPIDARDPEQRKAYCPDGVHFNDEGHKFLADMLIKTLEGLEE